MHSDFPVILDACVLATGALCDLYLRLAEPPRLYSPVWSDETAEEKAEIQDVLIRLGKTVPRFASHVMQQMGTDVEGSEEPNDEGRRN